MYIWHVISRVQRLRWPIRCYFLGTMQIAIIGGGPAGLRAAEVAASRGASVTVFDAKPSVGRKFLVAGRGGLNLTHTEDFTRFAARYHGLDFPREVWTTMLKQFDASASREWAHSLGVETFSASTGRVYPRGMKAAPLLRRWVKRLRDLGVHFAPNHRLKGIGAGKPLHLHFDVHGESKELECTAAILALGGASWPDTGSDGTWVKWLAKLGIGIAPLASANCGWEIDWSPTLLTMAEGCPLKNIVASAGTEQAAGELMITQYGLEGGAIYQLGAALRSMAEPTLTIDFKPSIAIADLVAKMPKPKLRLILEAQKHWNLSDAAVAILDNHPSRPAWTTVASLAQAVKACPIRLIRPRPISESISSAGGVRWSELDDQLMVRKLPGVFVAGEMIDWEAPTGGYLMQGCFASGTAAGIAATRWIDRK